MKGEIKLTVLMPVYNGGVFLAEAIESILMQTFADFEFLIIDDGSTDDSLAVIKSYSAKDQRIRLIARENRGFIETLAEGMREASTELIVRMDADDISLPDRFQKQYDFMISHPEYAIVGCQLQSISESGEYGAIDPRPTTDGNLKLFLGYGCALSGPTVLFRRSSLLRVDGFQKPGYPAEDYDCWTRLVMEDDTVKLYNLPDVLYLYRSNSAGISLLNKIDQIKKTIEIGDDYRMGMLKAHRYALTAEAHKEWFDDITHFDSEAVQEELKRIYYTTHAWFISDVKRLNRIRATFMIRRLCRLTRKYNVNDLHLIGNQPVSHTFPEE